MRVPYDESWGRDFWCRCGLVNGPCRESRPVQKKQISLLFPLVWPCLLSQAVTWLACIVSGRKLVLWSSEVECRKVHLSLLLIQHRAMKTDCRSGGMARRILNLSTRWKWLVRFTTLSRYPRGKRPRFQLDMRLQWPESFCLPGTEPVNVRTELPGLHGMWCVSSKLCCVENSMNANLTETP